MTKSYLKDVMSFTLLIIWKPDFLGPFAIPNIHILISQDEKQKRFVFEKYVFIFVLELTPHRVFWNKTSLKKCKLEKLINFLKRKWHEPFSKHFAYFSILQMIWLQEEQSCKTIIISSFQNLLHLLLDWSWKLMSVPSINILAKAKFGWIGKE